MIFNDVTDWMRPGADIIRVHFVYLGVSVKRTFKLPVFQESKQHMSAETKYKIGENAQGGIVFYVDTTGMHGLAAVARNLGYFSQASAIEWCKALNLNGYSDWYLPSKDELKLMYENIGNGAQAPLRDFGGFHNEDHWSSTMHDYSVSWVQDFNYGIQFCGTRGDALSVRAIRAF